MVECTRPCGRTPGWLDLWAIEPHSLRCVALRVGAGETNLKIKNCFGPTMGKHIAEDFKEWASQYHIR